MIETHCLRSGWIVQEFPDKVKKLFLVHGEYSVQLEWSDKLKNAGFKNIEIPEMKSVQMIA